jgi:hypothetical protein
MEGSIWRNIPTWGIQGGIRFAQRYLISKISGDTSSLQPYQLSANRTTVSENQALSALDGLQPPPAPPVLERVVMPAPLTNEGGDIGPMLCTCTKCGFR